MPTTDPQETPEREPMHAFRFEEPDIRPVAAEFSPLQKAVLPVVGFADGYVEPFATAFNVSSRLSITLTAWHVIEDFIEANEAGLRSGTCHLAVVLETHELLPGGGYLGGPVPVHSVTRVPETDLAVLRLFEVTSGSTPFAPDRLAGLSFAAPAPGDWCYGFGYPHLAGGPVKLDGGRAVVDFERTLQVTGGKVHEVFVDGRGATGGRLPPTCPIFDCDAPSPSGVSGGPFLADGAGLCGLLSTSYDPYEPEDRWATNVSLLTPLLGCPVRCADASGTAVDATFHELASDGYFDLHGALPPAPRTEAVEPIAFPTPTSLVNPT